jgi:GNAT superfamily N-acetyltransferase
VTLLPYRPEMGRQVVALWNAAMGDTFPLREALFRQNTVDDPHFDPAGCWVAPAPDGEGLLGVCLAKVAREPLGADGMMEDRGWVSALAVHPSAQRRGVGTALVQKAEAFLRARGRPRAVLGGDPAHFFPGVPVGAAAAAFFESRGYPLRGAAYDLRRSLGDYRTPPRVAEVLAAHPDIAVRPLRRGDEGALLAFLDAVFPGRWRYTLGRFLAGGGSPGDVMGIIRGGEVVGFAHLFHPGSRWVGPSIAWVRDGSARAGGLGPMGVAPHLRGQGVGLALLDRAVLHLASLGVEEMVIDWTLLLGFYGKLGFTPVRQYTHGERLL